MVAFREPGQWILLGGVAAERRMGTPAGGRHHSADGFNSSFLQA